jgi:hypothetical protein
MPEIITKEITVYDYDELSDKAKEKALEWFARSSDDDYWSECIIDSAKEEGKQYGFDIDDIRWSGFCSQGDGASWTGYVKLSKFLDACIGPEHPLFASAQIYGYLVADGWVDPLVEVSRYGYHYSHSGTMRIGEIEDGSLLYEVYRDEDEPAVLQKDGPLKGASVHELAKGIDAEAFANELLEEIKDRATQYADEIYKQLEEEYEWQTSEEHFKECIYINGWRFDEHGEIVE